MDTHTFEKLMKSIFFKDDIYMISDTVCVVNLHDPSMGGHGVFTVETTVAGLDVYARMDDDFAWAINKEDYELLIALVDSERDQVYAEREAMKLAKCISDVSHEYFGLPASYSVGATDETLAQYRAEYGDA